MWKAMWRFLCEVDVDREKDLRAYLDARDLNRRRLIAALVWGVTVGALAVLLGFSLPAKATDDPLFVTGFAILASLIVVLGINLVSIHADPVGGPPRRRAPASGALLWLACFAAIIVALELRSAWHEYAMMRRIDACAGILQAAARDRFKEKGTQEELTCSVS